jgi:hypothetical protein
LEQEACKYRLGADRKRQLDECCEEAGLSAAELPNGDTYKQNERLTATLSQPALRKLLPKIQQEVAEARAKADAAAAVKRKREEMEAQLAAVVKRQ